jgi:hypothetical protein
MNTITIALCEEDRKLLEDLMGSITLLASVTANAQPKEVQEKIIAEAIPEEPEYVPAPLNPDVIMPHPVDAVSPHADPEPAAEPLYTQAPLYNLDDLRAVVQRLIAPGSTKREAAQAIVHDYATKLSAIPVNKYDEVMGRLIKLEKEV